MEHNVGICKRTQCETTENERVLTSVYGPLSSVDLGVVFFALWERFYAYTIDKLTTSNLN